MKIGILNGGVKYIALMRDDFSMQKTAVQKNGTKKVLVVFLNVIVKNLKIYRDIIKSSFTSVMRQDLTVLF